MSDIRDYIKHIIKKCEILTAIPLIKDYYKRINNRLLLKMKDGHKLELRTPETMKLFGSTKELTGKTKKGENVPSLQVIEAVLVQCNFVIININMSISILYAFTPNKCYVYLCCSY